MVTWARFDYSRRHTVSGMSEASPGRFNRESEKEFRKGNSSEPRCQETLLGIGVWFRATLWKFEVFSCKFSMSFY